MPTTTCASAYEAWDNDSCDPEAANAVVAEINDVIDPYRDQFDNIVVLGGDLVIPMARLADHTVVANEYDFRNDFDQLDALTARGMGQLHPLRRSVRRRGRTPGR